jgi:multidrug efflux pump
VRTTGDYKELSTVLDDLQASTEKGGVLEEVWHDMHMDFPGLRANANERKMAMLEVSPQEVAKALETSFDKSSTLEFLKDGLRYDVRLYANRVPDDLSEVFVTNARGTPIPLSAVVELESVALPAALNHTRQLRSATFGAQLAKSQSLGQAIKYIDDKMKANLPSHFSYELTGAAQRQQESANVMLLLFTMALLFIYCVLAIQFESFVDPLIILLTVPLASCGALFFMWMFGHSLNIFSQIGLITLVGLITKHGILIVDFANHRLDEGVSTVEAILEAASQRLRPVLMTTGAMVFGSIPLMIASGAGSEARKAIGLVLVAGLAFGTVLTLFVIPVFYSFVKSHTPRKIAE